MGNMNIVAMLQSVSKELAEQLNKAGVSSKKAAEIVEAIEGKLSPAITEIEELRQILQSQFFSPSPGDTTGGKSTELSEKMKKMFGETDFEHYVDPESGIVKRFIFT